MEFLLIGVRFLNVLCKPRFPTVEILSLVMKLHSWLIYLTLPICRPFIPCTWIIIIIPVTELCDEITQPWGATTPCKEFTVYFPRCQQFHPTNWHADNIRASWSTVSFCSYFMASWFLNCSNSSMSRLHKRTERLISRWIFFGYICYSCISVENI